MLSDALAVQVGGDHYKKYAIQPIEFAMANNLNYCQANAIKYITRYRDKAGKQDLEKAIHNIQILMELEYGKERQETSKPQEPLSKRFADTKVRTKSSS